MKFLRKRRAKQHQNFENYYIGPEHFTDREIQCAGCWRFGFGFMYNGKGIKVNHLGFDFAHYYRVKQARGLIKTN